jgi:diaminohydroxyphosphoribosylaminopyrimidine deaminase/5-amino-6-(5-phosphoribosylamino)uracil reductase
MRMRQRRPFIRLKSGASLDGRVALANGDSKWITSEAARADVQHWRAQSGAVLTSAATVLADDPRLDVRIEAPRQPLRVVLDRRRAVRKTARVLAPPGEALVFAAPTTTQRKGPGEERLGDARVERIAVKRSHLDFTAVFARLADLEINDVLVEAGPRLSGALLAAGLVDEWLLYVAPKLLGKDAKPVAALARLTKLDDAPGFELLESKVVGPDLRLRLRPQKSGTGAEK